MLSVSESDIDCAASPALAVFDCSDAEFEGRVPPELDDPISVVDPDCVPEADPDWELFPDPVIDAGSELDVDPVS